MRRRLWWGYVGPRRRQPWPRHTAPGLTTCAAASVAAASQGCRVLWWVVPPALVVRRLRPESATLPVAESSRVAAVQRASTRRLTHPSPAPRHSPRRPRHPPARSASFVAWPAGWRCCWTIGAATQACAPPATSPGEASCPVRRWLRPRQLQGWARRQAGTRAATCAQAQGCYGAAVLPSRRGDLSQHSAHVRVSARVRAREGWCSDSPNTRTAPSVRCRITWL